MLNRKLLEVLSRLNPAERKRLRLLLQSPYFNNTQQAEILISLYDYIMQYEAEETHPMLQKNIVFTHFFPDKVFQEGEKNSLDGLMTKLFGLVRTFLSQEHLQANAYENEYTELFAWLKYCRKYGLEERFWQVAQALKKLQEEQPKKDAEYYNRQFKLAGEIAAFQTLTYSFQDDANIGTTSVYLDIYYSILHLEMGCVLQYQHKLSPGAQEYDAAQMETILAIAKKGGFEQMPLVELYRLIFELLRNPDDEKLHNDFEVLLEKSKGEIAMETLCNLKAYQRQFWVRHYTKSGLPFYRTKLFDLYKEHFEQGYFYVDGSITINALRMLLIFALKLGHFDWVKKVLDEHPPERICGTRYPVEAYNLNLAEYHFYKKEYEQALEKLQYRLFENPHFSILVDVLLVKIYVETQDDLLDSRMKALEQKVRRIKLADDSKIRYTNFLKKLDKINRHVWSKKTSRYDKMAQELKSIPQMIEREWLVEMLEKVAR